MADNTYEVIETGNNEVSCGRYPWDGNGTRDIKGDVALIAGGVGALAAIGKILYDKFIGEPKRKKAVEAQIAQEVSKQFDESSDRMIKEVTNTIRELLGIKEGDDAEKSDM